MRKTVKKSRWLWRKGESGKVEKGYLLKTCLHKEGPLQYKLARMHVHASSDVFAGFTTVRLHNDSFRQFDLHIVIALNKRFSLLTS